MATEILFSRFASLKIMAAFKKLPDLQAMICGLDMGIRLVPAPLKLKAVLRKSRFFVIH